MTRRTSRRNKAPRTSSNNENKQPEVIAESQKPDDAFRDIPGLPVMPAIIDMEEMPEVSPELIRQNAIHYSRPPVIGMSDSDSDVEQQSSMSSSFMAPGMEPPKLVRDPLTPTEAKVTEEVDVKVEVNHDVNVTEAKVEATEAKVVVKKEVDVTEAKVEATEATVAIKKEVDVTEAEVGVTEAKVVVNKEVDVTKAKVEATEATVVVKKEDVTEAKVVIVEAKKVEVTEATVLAKEEVAVVKQEVLTESKADAKEGHVTEAKVVVKQEVDVTEAKEVDVTEATVVVKQQVEQVVEDQLTESDDDTKSQLEAELADLKDSGSDEKKEFDKKPVIQINFTLAKRLYQFLISASSLSGVSSHDMTFIDGLSSAIEGYLTQIGELDPLPV
jgi:hypothetical protein